jgi:hypothetical protein
VAASSSYVPPMEMQSGSGQSKSHKNTLYKNNNYGTLQSAVSSSGQSATSKTPSAASSSAPSSGRFETIKASRELNRTDTIKRADTIRRLQHKVNDKSDQRKPNSDDSDDDGDFQENPSLVLAREKAMKTRNYI